MYKIDTFMLKVVGSMMMQPTRKEENWKEKKTNVVPKIG